MYEQVEKPIGFKSRVSVDPVSPRVNGIFNSCSKNNSKIEGQLKIVDGGVFQKKTDVRGNLNDATDTETSSKKIATPTQGEKWFRFKIAGNVINSFSDNIYPNSTDKGSNPVCASVEIGSQAESEGYNKDDLGSWSRGVHFGFGDRKLKIHKDARKGKWTWHHQMGKYNMELVDMYVHGGFGHHGGYSNWNDEQDTDDSGI